MKIAIVKITTKDDERYHAYKTGLLSRLGVFCPLNKIIGASGATLKQCIESAKSELSPSPPPKQELIDIVEI